MKIFVSAVIVFFCFSSLHAQTLSLGPTAGFGHTMLAIKDNSLNKRFFPGYNVGVKVVYSIVSHWGISADVKLSGEGGRLKGFMPGSSSEYDNEYRSLYVRIPFQGVYFFGKLGDPVRAKFGIGPSLGFLIGGTTSQHIEDVGTNTFKTKSILEGFDFGINTSFGANFRLKGDKWLNTDITYYHGITNISALVSRIRNRSLGFNIGLLFPIGASGNKK